MSYGKSIGGYLVDIIKAEKIKSRPPPAPPPPPPCPPPSM